MRVLVLEDDAVLNIELKEFLTIKSFEVVCAIDGEEAICKIDAQKFDLYIIDIFVPTINGLEILKFIRKIDVITPVIIITASHEINNLTQAYEYGCNEYIKKPFHIKELEVRMDKLLEQDSACIKFNNEFLYQKDKNEYLLNGEIIDFRKKEKRCLEILIKNINKTVHKDIMIDYIWEQEIKDCYCLRQLINGMRKKLPQNMIKTDIGIGYSIIKE